MRHHQHHQRPRRSRAPRTEAEVAALLDRLQRCNTLPATLASDEVMAVEGSGFRLLSGGVALDRKMRREMLAAIGGGDPLPEITFEATTYVQRPEPNRNYVRFKQGMLAGFAKSFRTAPFLADHDTWRVTSRGGTVAQSSATKLDGQVTNFDMTVDATTDWAVTGLLNGTIDRFSIGWSRTGPVECSLHKTEVFTKCDCWPGDEIGDEVVQFVFTAAEGTEVSAVNVPAVVGTGIHAITKLSALDPTSLKSILASTSRPAPVPEPQPPTKEETTMDPQMLAALGLPPTATQADVNAAIARLNAQSNETALQLETAEAASRKATIDTAIQALCAQGKLAPGGPVEMALRAVAAIGNDADPKVRKGALAASLALFSAQVDQLRATPSINPAGAPTPALTADPVPAQKPAPLAGTVPTGDQQLAASPELANWLRNAGITKEQFEKHGQLGRAFVAGGMFERAPARRA